MKIADFGLSARREGDAGTGIHYSTVGTRQYQAPEVLEQRSYRGDRIDIFSMGIILFTMVTGAMPYFKEASVEDPLYKMVIKNDPFNYWMIWHHIRSTPPADSALEQDSFDDIMNPSSLLNDFKMAICGCIVTFFANIKMLLWYLSRIVLFIFTLGTSRLIFTEDINVPV